AKGNAEQGRRLQAVPVEKLREVVNKVHQPEGPAQGEAVVFAAELIADHAEVGGQETGQRPEQFKPPGQPRHEHERRTVSPFAIFDRVISEMSTPGQTRAGTKLGSGSR